jgi:hypothetical protein
MKELSNSLIKLDNLKESNIPALTDPIKKAIEAGEMDALEVHMKAKYLLKALKQIADISEEQALDEADKYSKEERNKFGAKFSPSYGRDTYDYSQDEEYAFHQRNMKEREAKLKEALKLADKFNGAAIIDGEEVPIVPVKSKGKRVLTVSFK